MHASSRARPVAEEPVARARPSPQLATASAYEEHRVALIGYVRGLTRNSSVAEDVVQEAFARLARELQAGRSVDKVGPWLRRVSANLVASHGRAMQTAERHAGRLAVIVEAVSPETIVVEAERSMIVRNALDDLAPLDRRALLLAAQGYRGPEIATLIGRTEGATRTLMCRARARLRERLIQGGGL